MGGLLASGLGNSFYARWLLLASEVVLIPCPWFLLIWVDHCAEFSGNGGLHPVYRDDFNRHAGGNPSGSVGKVMATVLATANCAQPLGQAVYGLRLKPGPRLGSDAGAGLLAACLALRARPVIWALEKFGPAALVTLRSDKIPPGESVLCVVNAGQWRKGRILRRRGDLPQPVADKDCLPGSSHSPPG